MYRDELPIVFSSSLLWLNSSLPLLLLSIYLCIADQLSLVYICPFSLVLFSDLREISLVQAFKDNCVYLFKKYEK